MIEEDTTSIYRDERGRKATQYETAQGDVLLYVKKTKTHECDIVVTYRVLTHIHMHTHFVL